MHKSRDRCQGPQMSHNRITFSNAELRTLGLDQILFPFLVNHLWP